MALLIITIILIYIVLIIWSLKNLGYIEKKKKIIYIIAGIIITYILTTIIFLISKGDINYPNNEIEKAMQNILVILFTGINACIIMPYIAKTLDRLNENEITKEKLIQRMVIIVAIIAIICIFEGGYIKSIQNGIIGVIENLNK